MQVDVRRSAGSGARSNAAILRLYSGVDSKSSPGRAKRSPYQKYAMNDGKQRDIELHHTCRHCFCASISAPVRSKTHMQSASSAAYSGCSNPKLARDVSRCNAIVDQGIGPRVSIASSYLTNAHFKAVGFSYIEGTGNGRTLWTDVIDVRHCNGHSHNGLRKSLQHIISHKR